MSFEKKKRLAGPRKEVGTHLVLRGVTHEPLGVGEGDVGRRGTVAAVVRDDLHAMRVARCGA